MSARTFHAALGAALVLALPNGVRAQFPTTPPAAAPVKPAEFPPFQEATLANGVRVVLVENHRDPVVAWQLILPAGNTVVPNGREGLADLVATLLTKGAAGRTADQVSAAIEGAGGAFSGGAGNDFLTLSGNVLSDSTALAFRLLGEAVRAPAFDPKELDLLRTQTLSALQLAEAQPASIASRAIRAGLYGKHPYGRSATPASVRAITRDDLLAFQRARIRPQGAILVVAGDVTMAKLRTLATQAFAGWTGAPAAAPVLPALPTRSATEILLVHRPGSVQSNLVVGNLTTGPVDAARYGATVANKLLGGGADARLFMILREQKGWTYGAYSDISRPRGTGAFTAQAEVRTEVTDSALVELLGQLRRLTNERVPADELENAKGALVGSFPLVVETAQGIAAQVAQVKTLGLPADYLRTYRTRLAAITPDAAQASARAYVRPQQALVVVVGDGTRIYDKLARIAPVKIVNPQGDPLAPSDLAPRTAGPVALDLARLTAHRDSFVVRVQGNALGYTVSSVERQGDGWAITESSSIAGGIVAQKGTLVTDASLAPRSLSQSGSTQGQATKGEVTYANGRAKGSATTASAQGPKTVTVDAELPAGTLDDNALTTALPLMAWAPGASFTVSTFASGKNAVVPVTLKVAGTESVTVPAGTFEAYRIDATGGEAPMTFWVTTAAPRRLVKFALVGQPLEFVLAK